MSCLFHFRQRLSVSKRGKIFWARDEGSLWLLLPLLLAANWLKRRMGRPSKIITDAVFNDPSNLPLRDQKAAARARYSSNDVLVRTTRFGMDDTHPRHARRRRRVPSTRSFEERCFVRHLRKIFKHLSRTEVEFTPAAAQLIPAVSRTAFRLTDGDEAAIGYLFKDNIVRKKSGETVTSPAFIVYIRELWEDGPAGLCIFAMSGCMTYGFSHFLAHNMPEILHFEESSFIYCEISSDGALIPGNEPRDASFTRNWTVTVHRPGCDPVIYAPPARDQAA